MTAEPFDVVSDKLGGLHHGMACCPAHEDRAPSLSVTRGDDGQVLLHCHAGCEVDQIVAAIGLTKKDLFLPRQSTNGHKRIVATYDYNDERGDLLYQVVRYDPKTFKQRRPNGRDGWEWTLKGTRRVLYRLPRVLAAVAAGEVVYVAEGEKDVHALEAAGVTATTNAQGATKWSTVPDAGKVLAGATVIVVADADEPGRRHAAEVAADLRGHGCIVFVREPPEPHKDVADLLGAGGTLDDLIIVYTEQVQSAQTCGNRTEPPDDLAALLDEVATFLKKFMVMTDHQSDAVTLFAAHTHAIEAFDVCAYLFITSAVRRSGKTLLEELLEQICLRGRSTTNISPAAVYRMVDEVKPTLLFDEVDNIFTKGRGGDPTKTDLIGLINAGYRRGKPAYRMGGPNMRTLEAFDPFGPKVLAGIGGCLPDTTEDRCIKIRLERKDRTRQVERYRIRLHEAPARELGQRLASISALTPVLRDCWPALPDELDDRAQDIWEPLLAIAETADGDWPQRARAAALALNDLRADNTEPAGIDLLADIRRLFGEAGEDRISSAVLVEKLNAMDETPWAGWHRGAGFRTFDLARLLRDFGIRSGNIRLGDDVKKGYQSEHFVDAWARYLDSSEPGDSSATGATTATSGETPGQPRSGNVADGDSEAATPTDLPLWADVADVADVAEHHPHEEEPTWEQLHLSTAPSATDASDNDDSTTSSTTTESSAPDASTDTTSTTRPTEAAAPEPASPTPSDSGPDDPWRRGANECTDCLAPTTDISGLCAGCIAKRSSTRALT